MSSTHLVEGDFVSAVELLVAGFSGVVRIPLTFESNVTVEEARQELQSAFEGRGVKVRIGNASPLQEVVQEARTAAGMGPHPTFKPWAYFEPEEP